MGIFGLERYRFGLAAGGIVLRGDSVLMVHNFEPGGDDFWVLPGGGAEEGESLDDCAVREVREETGLAVIAEKLVYIEQFVEDAGQTAKLWFLCRESGQNEISIGETDTEPIVDARFLERDEMADRTVYPPVLKDRFWEDRDAGFPTVRILPLVDVRL